MITKVWGVVVGMGLVSMALVTGAVHAQTSVYTGANGSWSVDTWNTAGNWNSGSGPVPSGTVNVEIQASKSSWALNETPAYTGSLIIGTNSTLGINSSSSLSTANAFGTETITMASGSVITMRYSANYTFNQPFVLTGNATIRLSDSTSGHNNTRTFSSPLSGNHFLTLQGQNGNHAILNASNSVSKLSASVSGSANWKVVAGAAGALGNGDVIINTAVNLVIGAGNAMNSQSVLYLNGVRSTKIAGENKLVLNQNLQVYKLYVDGGPLTDGQYTKDSGLLDSGGNALISGNYTLTVKGPAAGTVIYIR